MVDYYEVRFEFSPFSSDASDLLASMLAEIDYDSFVEEDNALLAYVPQSKFSEEKIDEILSDFPFDCKLTWSVNLIKGKNWNEEWEKNYFKPIVIDDKCVVHSTFHKDVPKADYDIVVDPKMAFGTGHHATTSNILRFILSLPMEGKKIVDVGTGTGILAILCMKRGASDAVGIEIDEDAYLNALDNVKLNNVDVTLIHGDAHALKNIFPGEGADYVLANINRNIVVADMDKYVDAMSTGANLILSGFYEEDIPIVMEKASSMGLILVDKKSDNNWVALRLRKGE